MTTETSNARGEVVAWFPTNAQGEIIRNYGDGSPVYACRTKEEAEQAKRCHLGATGPVIPLYAAPPPAAAEPKTLPVPTHVYLTDKAAVIVGYPQRGWDEEGPDAHNCDDMGCSTIGPHVLARVPFTDERALSQPAEGEDIMVNTPYDVFTLPLRPSGLDGNGPRFVVHVPAPEQQPAAVSDDDDAEPGEPCESGLPDCGPAVAWDCEGIGACERCARELGWIATPHREPTTPL